MEFDWWTVSIATLILFLLSRIQKVYDGKRAVDNLPGLIVPFRPFGFPGLLLPTTWWNPGLEFVWKWKNNLYNRFDSDTISIVPFLIGGPTIVTHNIDVVRQILGGSHKTPFVKHDISAAGPLGYWGPNLLLAEGDVWRKHRRIVGPAFSQKLYELVWNESLNLYSEMLVAEGFEGKKVVEVPRVQNITFNFAFLIIGRCGFDFPFSWTERIEAHKDGAMSFTEAMRIFTRSLGLLLLPKSVRSLPVPRLKQVNASMIELQRFMEKTIAEKEEEVRNNGGIHEKDDIFSMLIQANHAESDAKLKLDYSELISDVFIMLLAGHETTAHSLANTMACLARYPEQQQEIVDQVLSVIGTDRDPTIDDVPKLNKVQACFYEALRLFPIAFAATRVASEDAILNIPKADGQTTTIAVRKGMELLVDYIAVHRDPRQYEDPEEYKPSRWYGVSNESEALSAFGLGQRSCIGRKFAITESVCLISLFLRDWKIEPLTKPGESVERWFDKISQARILLTLAAGDVGLRFIRRE